MSLMRERKRGEMLLIMSSCWCVTRFFLLLFWCYEMQRCLGSCDDGDGYIACKAISPVIYTSAFRKQNKNEDCIRSPDF